MPLRLLAGGVAVAPRTVPVTPDADEARRWAEDELARGIYTQRTGLGERLVGWVLDRLDALVGLTNGAGWVLPTALVGLTAAVVTVALVVGAPTRRRAARPVTGVLDGEERSAAELRATAAAATAAGDHAAAVTDRFRAVVRELAERALLEESPGLTADEAATTAGDRLPPVARDLAVAAEMFDGVRYGDVRVGAREDAWLADLDARVTRARPTLATPRPEHAQADR